LYSRKNVYKRADPEVPVDDAKNAQRQKAVKIPVNDPVMQIPYNGIEAKEAQRVMLKNPIRPEDIAFKVGRIAEKAAAGKSIDERK